MVRINFNITDEIKEKWDEFVANSDEFSTLSKFIRESVEKNIKSNIEHQKLEDFSKQSHNLKENLNSIKGFSQMIIEEYKDELSFEILKKISEIYERSVNIENILSQILREEKIDKKEYDILIVDDDPSTIDLLTDFFQKRGKSVKSLSSVRETLNFLKYSKPKVILLDVILNDGDGYGVANWIKEKEHLEDIPVYFITAVPWEELKEHLDNVEGFFLKPFDWVEFEKLVEVS